MSDRRILKLFEEQKETMTERITRGIETYRKGEGRIRVVDREGRPVAKAEVKLCQRSHEFRFGANLFMLDELETDEKNEAYKKYFSELFNMGTLPFYWDALEPERGMTRYTKDSPKIYRRPTPDLCLEFCESHGIEPREHALAYDGFFPKWLYDADVEEVKRELARRFREVAERYAERIPTIEVTNEMSWPHGRTAFYDEPDYVEWCYRTAEKYFPNNRITVNECTELAWMDRCRATDKYYAYLEANLLKGVRMDAIGMQYHLFYRREELYDKAGKTLLNPQRLFGTMDLYSRFGKPLQITEITIPAYSREREDEELQAELLEYLYSIWFSHPSVEQIVYWNLVDGYAHLWDPDPEKIKASQGDMTLGENYYHGGLLRFDLSPKPAYDRLKELLEKRWHTEETLVTDGEGCVSFRGFFGDYSVKIERDGGTDSCALTLKKGGDNQFVLNL